MRFNDIVREEKTYSTNIPAELDEDWKSTLGNLAIAGTLAAAGTGGIMAKKAASDYFSSAKEPAPITATAPDAKKTEPTVQKNIVVQPITGSALEKTLMSVARSHGIKGIELAQLMAQASHETLDFKRLTEFGGSLDFRKYDPKYAPKKAAALGNKKVGDGARYKGRGFLQITGRYNYKKAGEALRLPLERHPEMVEDPKVAAEVAIWFWKHRVQPNVDNFQNVNAVTKQINPGMHGLEGRKENFKDYLTVAGYQLGPA